MSRQKKRLHEEVRDDIARMRTNGLTAMEIGKQLGMTSWSVLYHIRKIASDGEIDCSTPLNNPAGHRSIYARSKRDAVLRMLEQGKSRECICRRMRMNRDSLDYLIWGIHGMTKEK